MLMLIAVFVGGHRHSDDKSPSPQAPDASRTPSTRTPAAMRQERLDKGYCTSEAETLL